MLIRSAILAAGLATSLTFASPTANAGPDEYIGEIFMTGANFCPRGTAKADGQLLPIPQYTALFSLYGTIYGGDGRSTFALPDLRGRVPVHNGQGPGLNDRRIGQRGGAESATLTEGNLPAHSHAITVPEASPSNPGGGAARGQGQGTSTQSGSMTDQVTGVTGGNQPVSTLDPYLSVQFCVVLEGIYPSRN